MSKVSFRDHRTYLVHLLRVLHRAGAVPPAGIYDEVADGAAITDHERTTRGRFGLIYSNRIQFARQHLIDAGLMVGREDEGWKRGVWELNAAGHQLAAGTLPDEALDAELRKRGAEGAKRRAQARKASRQLAGLAEGEDAVPLADEPDSGTSDGNSALSIAELVDAANAAAMETMLEHVRGLTDRAFEYLVGSVLKAALRAESVKVTQKTRDGGIDGILSFDGLGMRIAVFEAKRYADGNTVGRSLIDAFATAARRHRAAHSLFVTTSRFSSEAITTGKDEAIRLIDGIAFVELMARHGIGLRERDSYVVYEIDPAWSVDSDEEQGEVG